MLWGFVPCSTWLYLAISGMNLPGIKIFISAPAPFLNPLNNLILSPGLHSPSKNWDQSDKCQKWRNVKASVDLLAAIVDPRPNVQISLKLLAHSPSAVHNCALIIQLQSNKPHFTSSYLVFFYLHLILGISWHFCRSQMYLENLYFVLWLEM